MGRQALVASHRCRTGQIEMNLLLAEQQSGAALAHSLGPHAEHPLVKVEAAVEIGDGDV